MPFPTFIDHIVFRVVDLDRTKTFYTALLGAPAFTNETAALFRVGETGLFFTTAAPAAGAFEKEDVGINHIAFGVRTLAELSQTADQLTAAAIAHSGIRIDPHGQKEYIWFDDPDGLRVEFYLRAA